MEDLLLALVDRKLDSRAARNAARATIGTIAIGDPGNSLPIIGTDHLTPIRSSVLRTSFRGRVQRFDPGLFAPSHVQSLGDYSIETQDDRVSRAPAALESRLVDTTAIPNLPASQMRSPEPEFRNLLSTWVPSKRNSPYRRGHMKILFESASKAIENKSGAGRGNQYPSERIYSRQWNNEVTALLSRRAKVVIYGDITGKVYTSLLAMNRDDLIAYFHGNVQRTDHLLNWWQMQ